MHWHSRAHISTPPFSHSSGTPEVCTFQETAARPTLARQHFRYSQLLVDLPLPLIHSESYKERQRNNDNIVSRDKSQTAISEKSEKRIVSRTDAHRGCISSVTFIPSCERRPACGMVDVNATPIVHDASRRPARCMHASVACNARILPREASRGMRRTIYEGGVI